MATARSLYSARSTSFVVPKLGELWSAVKSFILGATVYPLIRELEEEATAAERLFLLAVFGDMVGLPVSSYYRLRLLPHVVPRLRGWKLYLAKERDVI